MLLLSYLFFFNAKLNIDKLIQYLGFIKSSAQLKRMPHRTHRHHIVQKAILLKLGLPKKVVDDKSNLVYLLTSDHLKAHLLWVDAIDCWESRSTLGVFKKIFDDKNIDLTKLTQEDRVNFIQRLEKYYTELSVIQKKRRSGYKASPETIEKMRIAGTKGKGKKHNRRKEHTPRNISPEGRLAKQEAGRKQSKNLSIYRNKAHEGRRKYAKNYEGWYMQTTTGVFFNIKYEKENDDLGFKNFKWVVGRGTAGGHNFVHLDSKLIKNMIDSGSFSSVYDIPKYHSFLKKIKPRKIRVVCPFCGKENISTNTGWLSHHFNNCKNKTPSEFFDFH
ncbi:MAG: hypothetical protein LBR10_10415 [Prevotellaceae bacterium]|jgi:hypothetical protein|nr:hypothetical protein [Prevotellaceae bacterium]